MGRRDQRFVRILAGALSVDLVISSDCEGKSPDPRCAEASIKNSGSRTISLDWNTGVVIKTQRLISRAPVSISRPNFNFSRATNLQNKRKCKCQGTVENCAFCFGSGEIVSHDDSLQSYTPVRQKRIPDLPPFEDRIGSQSGTNDARAIPEVCDRCNFHGSPEALKAHKEQRHPSREVRLARELAQRNITRKQVDAQAFTNRNKESPRREKLQKQSVKKAGRSKREWKAAVKLRKKLISATLSKISSAKHTPPRSPIHPVQLPVRPALLPTPEPRPTTLREALIASGVIRPAAQVGVPNEHLQVSQHSSSEPGRGQTEKTVLCPLCHEELKALGHNVKKKLVKHLNSEHPLNRPSLSKAQPSHPRSKLSRSDHVPESRDKGTQESVWQEPTDMMDANRGMGAFARDNGRFGSHALHDRFDDEGMP